ncbi:NgoPII family restriction endonuclease [Listeria monocytogenes]|uniref:NgoPII family restriction endonuclease n=1 Tax=Listeria monocytogenes TaxID=1639 RepID=UPI0010DE9985|nr:NgoPII family restriction endonuclease [Listeria monocytogenes]EAD1221440.1 NgoPII family restriction endonuclease [Listeria monocytogenes]EAE5855662.1 NgoPII family restriction endonuclease [Listeria monocytogenes]EAE8881752.1 NgoPII family restriction endonuclease [Listeria monocytogenes]EAE8894547.1 NgoPII family restriction endonuclease [Listeria monocytogenes]EGW7335635.1 NgoPII family restriction endonuclease [Listeria monocytogenes]
MSEYSNVLIALSNILERNSCRLTPIFRGNGAANAAGDSLEFFVKDMFCTGASAYSHQIEKEKHYDKYLSWKGNSSNFPDFIIKEGVGVEPKKMNGKGVGNLALNSSFPKAYIYPDTQNLPIKELIMESQWEKKEIVYVVGNLNEKDDKLYRLWLAYGNTFIARESIYLDLKESIKEAVVDLPDAIFVDTKEFGRIKKVDPLGNSNLRLRGMWELSHPEVVFQKYLQMNVIPEDATKINLIITENEYENLSDKPDLSRYINENRLQVQKILIPNPNNLEEEISAYLFEAFTD